MLRYLLYPFQPMSKTEAVRSPIFCERDVEPFFQLCQILPLLIESILEWLMLFQGSAAVICQIQKAKCNLPLPKQWPKSRSRATLLSLRTWRFLANGFV